jgi:hypothetical protein
MNKKARRVLRQAQSFALCTDRDFRVCRFQLITAETA